jgi:hypothetical protein
VSISSATSYPASDCRFEAFSNRLRPAGRKSRICWPLSAVHPGQQPSRLRGPRLCRLPSRLPTLLSPGAICRLGRPCQPPPGSYAATNPAGFERSSGSGGEAATCHDGLGNFPSKPALTVATTCSNTAFLFFAVGDSGLSCPWYSSACISISCSQTWINTIRPSSPNCCARTDNNARDGHS